MIIDPLKILLKNHYNVVRKTFLITLLPLLLIAPYGCQNYGNESRLEAPRTLDALEASVDETQELRLSGSSWTSGDAIGLFAFYSNNPSSVYAPISNLKYTTNGDGLFTSAQRAPYPSDGAPLNLIAYYPYDEAVSGYNYPIDLAKQQEFLYSNNVTNHTRGSRPSMLFKRMLTKLELTITVPNISLPLTITAKGITTTASCNLLDGTLTTQTTGDLNITPAPAANQYTATILLLPIEQTEGLTLNLQYNGKSYTWKNSQPLQASRRYQYALNIKDGSISSIARGSYTETPVHQSGTYPNNFLIAHHMVAASSWIRGSHWPIGGQRNYTVGYDQNKRVTLWVSYPMHENYMGSATRTNAWRWDPIVPQSVQPNLKTSYKPATGNTYHRGHLLASAARDASTEINRTTFFYTNITPQNQRMNDGKWAQLEGKEQNNFTNAMKYDTLFVVTGAIYAPTPAEYVYDSSGSGYQYPVPTHLYKAFMRRDKLSGEYQTMGVKMVNNSSALDYTQCIVSVESLEQETGFVFFPTIPQEAKRQTTAWY